MIEFVKWASEHHEFLADVRDRAKAKGYDIFAVVNNPKEKDGASIYSNTGPRDHTNAVHQARKKHMVWEKAHGFDPDHDWSKEAAYSRPMTSDELKKYPHLVDCPIHSWRAETGVELIHKEPDEKEQHRIYKNWNAMSPEQKATSDNKSKELFGKTNEEHHQRIMKTHWSKS